MNLRQQTILQLVNDRRRISVNELARASGVSEVTIRQDLNLLEKRSYLKRITLITVSHYIANLLKETDCDVIVLGGMYQKKSETVVGPLTRLCIQQVHFNKAFIGIDGFQAETGFTGRDMMRADVVSAVLAKPLAQPGQISRVITDSRLALEYQHQLKRQGVQVELVND